MTDTTTDTNPLSGEIRPPEWKGMDDFAKGIDGNRLPRTDDLAGRSMTVETPGTTALELSFGSADEVQWRSGERSGTDWYEHIAIRDGVHYLTITYGDEPLHGDVVVINENTGRTLTASSRIANEPTPGRPRVSNDFAAGTLTGADLRGNEPGPSRDFIGWRALYRYSPNHLYEHIYLSSERYCWQCIVGEQRGHGDVDLTTTWSMGDNLYVFTFREFLIPVAATWLYDLDAMRTTGTFFGLGAGGSVRCAPGGAFITDLGRATYPDDQPV